MDFFRVNVVECNRSSSGQAVLSQGCLELGRRVLQAGDDQNTTSSSEQLVLSRPSQDAWVMKARGQSVLDEQLQFQDCVGKFWR
jgi:hypothetical protein